MQIGQTQNVILYSTDAFEESKENLQKVSETNKKYADGKTNLINY